MVLCAMLPALPSQAQSEDQIKAAFLLNFARYVDWPSRAFASNAAPVRICLLGAGAFGGVVSSTVEGKTVGSRPVRVDALGPSDATDGCHILFVGERFSEDGGDVGAVLGATSVFTVGNETDFARRGGVANFFRADNKVRFEINPRAARTAGLKISSRLLRLARLVE